MLLNGKWNLIYTNDSGAEICEDAIVPGCIHTDLLRNGSIDDFYFRDNAKKVQWIENIDCIYIKKFNVVEPEQNSYIKFESLDTYCDVYLNNNLIGKCANMFIPYEFNVDGILKCGENVLRVEFRSPIKEVQDMPKLLGSFTTERLRTRRIQCTYGWDWVERFVTMGICGNVELYTKKPNSINNAYIYTKHLNNEFAQIAVEIDISEFVDNGQKLEMIIFDSQGTEIYRKSRVIIADKINQTIDIMKPELWFPLGYGKQPLYKICLSTPSDIKEINFGIRSVCVLQAEDVANSDYDIKCKELRAKSHLKGRDLNDKGSSFIVYVNGIRIMCKGGSWVPCEPFPSAESNEKITNILELSVSSGVNMIRVWGGGVFEKSHFYNECDRLGILVLQDFLMACGKYPEEEEWFIEELKKEAQYASVKLRNHPCLIWWHGDNENGVKGNENITNYDGYLCVKNALMPTMKRFDPNRYFLSTTPFGGNTFSSVTVGTSHVTAFLRDIFNYIENSDFSDYTEYLSGFISRFCSEFPTFGLPFVSSLRNFLTEEDIFGDDDTILKFHSKGNPSMAKGLYDYFCQMAEKIFGSFKDGVDKIIKQQYLQCELIRISFETYRRNKWFSSGILFWMLNDCWPASSGWSLIDYYAKPKPAYYTFARCAKPVIASIDNKKGKLCVYICNDSLNRVSGTGKIYAYDTVRETECGKSYSFQFVVESNQSSAVFEIEENVLYYEKSLILCDIDIDGYTDRAFYIKRNFSDLNYKNNNFDLEYKAENLITIKAKGFVPFALLDLPFTVNENCFMMKQGEVKTIKKL